VNNSFDFKICIKRQLINNSKRNYCIAIKRQQIELHCPVNGREYLSKREKLAKCLQLNKLYLGWKMINKRAAANNLKKKKRKAKRKKSRDEKQQN